MGGEKYTSQSSLSAAVSIPHPQDATSLYTNGFHFLKGRIALCAILKAFGIGRGDEVVIQAFTCCAVPLAVLGAGAQPVFADIELSTLNLDPSSADERITGRTRAIVVQHTFGVPADMDAILRIARKRGLYVIEDCCHTVASQYGGKLVGHIGDATFSAYGWGKPITLGIGGSAIIHAEEPRKRLEGIYEGSRTPGAFEVVRARLEHLAYEVLLRPSTFWYLRDGFRKLGTMGAVTPTFTAVELQGSLTGMNKIMPRHHQRRLAKRIRAAFDEDVQFRRSRATAYAASLRDIGVRTCKLNGKVDPVFLRYPLLAAEKARILLEARKRRVELGDWFVSAVHPHADSECEELGYRMGMCPNAELAGRQVLTLPIYDKVRQHDVGRAIGLLNDVHRQGLL